MSIRSWLRTHRKKIITHTAIIVAFILFTVFAMPPLFDRLEAVPGEAQLHQLHLPAETTNMRYYISYINTDDPSAVEILGWAFVEGQDSQKRELYIILKSAQRTYVFNTKLEMVPALNVISEAVVVNADFSGFKTLIPTRKINDGEYIVGFYAKYEGREALYYTDRVVTKSRDSVTTALLMSKPVEVTLPEESGDMQFYVAAVSNQTDGDQEFVEIRGWAFIEGSTSTKDSRTYVVLESDTSTYVFDTIRKYYDGVACNFGNCYKWDLDYSGFIARIPVDKFKDGTYRLGIYIAKAGIEAFRYTDSVVTKEES